MESLSKTDIERLFNLLNEELRSESIKGEIYLIGGAVMCLVYKARPSTKDVDALFEPAKKIREAARRVALKTGVKEDWLNDSAKGYLSSKVEYETFLELSNLSIFTAKAEYLLAMKCLAMRIGEEFHDINDIRYLIRFLNLTSYKQILNVIKQYYPLEKFPQKTLYALEEFFEEG